MAEPASGQVPVYWTRSERPDKFEILDGYCDRDVEVQTLLHDKLRPLSTGEREVMLADMEVNDRGVHIDMESVRGALKIIATGRRRLDKEIARLTKHAVAKTSETAKLTAWLNANGLDVPDLQKDTLARVLADPNTDPLLRQVVQLRAWGSKSSTSKLAAMQHYAANDNRARGLHVFHGAASTGRFSSAGIQTQNMIRPSGLVDHTKTPEVFDDIRRGDYDLIELKWGPPFQVIADCLRGFITAAPGKVLYIADFAQIEARIIAMLAGQRDLVDVFVAGGDVYKVTASKILGVPIEQITKDQRQLGKVIVLACGFGMGAGKFQDTALTYGVVLTATEAETYVKAYRDTNKKIKSYWYRLEEAAVNATANPGAVFKVGDIAYKRVGRFLNCRLPSGRILTYPYPRLEEVETPWGALKKQLSYLGVDAVTKMPRRISAYGGLLAENIVQAVASDCLRAALLRLRAVGLPVVLHVHDEVVVEIEESPAVHARMAQILGELPDFAKALGWPGLLIAAEVDPPCLRYKK